MEAENPAEGPQFALTIQLLRWIQEAERTYADTMDAWRTSCPRLSVWEDAQAAGLVQLLSTPDGPQRVVLTDKGRSLLRSHA
jgi:hypothetical protein